MAITDKKISTTYAGRDISSLSDKPNQDGLTGAQLKARFDQLGKEVIPNFNALIDELNDTVLPAKADQATTYTETEVDTLLNNKVDKVAGKSLIADTEITRLLGIETGAEVNNISDVNATDLTDGGDTNLHTHDSRYYTETETNTLLGNKADKLFATNLVTNGDFSNGTTGWSVVNTTISALNNELTVTATAQYGVVRQAKTLVVGNKYYVRANVKTSSYQDVKVQLDTGAVYCYSNNVYNLISFITTATNTSVNFVIQDNRASGWTPNYVKNVIIVDLTATFGAGKEPTKTEFETMLSTFTNSWFNGTSELVSITNLAQLKADKLFATNIVTNGDFSNGTTGWVHYSTFSTESVVSGWLRSTKDTSKPYFGQNGSYNLASGKKVYVSFRARSSINSTAYFTFSSTTIGLTNTGRYTYNTTSTDTKFSEIITLTGVANSFWFEGVSLINSGDYLEVRYPIIIDLTAIFGAGKEPTKNEMDNLLSTFPNSWFNGTAELVNIANLAQLKADKTQEAWITPTLLNSWVNSGSAMASFQYMKDSLGFVHIKGTIKGGSSGTVVFTLPVGYRPAAQINAIGLDVNATTKIISIANNGTVTLWGAYTSSVSLDGIIFKAEV